MPTETPTREEMLAVLTRYEGAVNTVEVDGDETAIEELKNAREALMNLLSRALSEIPAPQVVYVSDLQQEHEEIMREIMS